ncbi:MAG: energy transducer TonB [Myxococcales bacterium]|nr:energy transducer TonB [Myxococcales bacterium]
MPDLAPPPLPPPPPPSGESRPDGGTVFGTGMDRPHKLSGPDPAYTPEARDAHVEGTILVQCSIGTDGRLTGCSILKSLPLLDRAVLDALAQQRWTPVTFQGQPVAVRYVFRFAFKL